MVFGCVVCDMSLEIPPPDYESARPKERRPRTPAEAQDMAAEKAYAPYRRSHRRKPRDETATAIKQLANYARKSVENDVVVTPCGHSFHHACLLEWFNQSNCRNCPSCDIIIIRSDIVHLSPVIVPDHPKKDRLPLKPPKGVVTITIFGPEPVQDSTGSPNLKDMLEHFSERRKSDLSQHQPQVQRPKLVRMECTEDSCLQILKNIENVKSEFGEVLSWLENHKMKGDRSRDLIESQAAEIEDLQEACDKLRDKLEEADRLGEGCIRLGLKQFNQIRKLKCELDAMVRTRDIAREGRKRQHTSDAGIEASPAKRARRSGNDDETPAGDSSTSL